MSLVFNCTFRNWTCYQTSRYTYGCWSRIFNFGRVTFFWHASVLIVGDLEYYGLTGKKKDRQRRKEFLTIFKDYNVEYDKRYKIIPIWVSTSMIKGQESNKSHGKQWNAETTMKKVLQHSNLAELTPKILTKLESTPKYKEKIKYLKLLRSSKYTGQMSHIRVVEVSKMWWFRRSIF